jgi:DNA-binding transcriptional ArsR family regulator
MAVPIFAALGDATRLRIVEMLGAGAPLSTTELTGTMRVTRQAVTKHLQVLADAGLVRDEKIGRERQWALSTARLREAQRHLEAISTQWDEAIGRLRAMVED